MFAWPGAHSVVVSPVMKSGFVFVPVNTGFPGASITDPDASWGQRQFRVTEM